MTKRALGLLAALTLAGCSYGAGGGGGASPADGGGTGQIVAQGFAFNPADVTVAVGGSLTFVNKDSARHTVTEGTNGQPKTGARFDQPLDNTSDAKVVISFPDAGAVEVTCKIHPSMHLTVHVVRAGESAPPPAASPSPSSRGYSYFRAAAHPSRRAEPPRRTPGDRSSTSLGRPG